LILEGKHARIVAIRQGKIIEHLQDAQETAWKDRAAYTLSSQQRSISEGQSGLQELKKRFYKEVLSTYKSLLNGKLILLCPEEDTSMIEGLFTSSQRSATMGKKAGAYFKAGQNELLEIATRMVN